MVDLPIIIQLRHTAAKKTFLFICTAPRAKLGRFREARQPPTYIKVPLSVTGNIQ